MSIVLIMIIFTDLLLLKNYIYLTIQLHTETFCPNINYICRPASQASTVTILTNITNDETDSNVGESPRYERVDFKTMLR